MIEAIFSTIIPAIVGALTSLAGAFLYRRQTATSKDLENEAKAIENANQQAKSLVEMVDWFKVENKRLREENTTLRDENKNISEENASIRIDRARLIGSRCDVYSCQLRKPPLKELVEE
jgi:septal ring factor EnvC (AmiA/AmiB activator)